MKHLFCFLILLITNLVTLLVADEKDIEALENGSINKSEFIDEKIEVDPKGKIRKEEIANEFNVWFSTECF